MEAYIPHNEIDKSFMMTDWRVMPSWIERYYDRMSPEDRYEYTIEAYILAPYKSIPKKKIIDLKKIRPENYLRDLDPELRDVDPITIYRTSAGDPHSVKNDLSWTSRLNVAVFFYKMKEERGEKSMRIWEGTIEKKDIIAVTNNRREHEIIQHHSVKDIHEIILSEEEIAAALDEYSIERDAPIELD